MPKSVFRTSTLPLGLAAALALVLANSAPVHAEDLIGDSCGLVVAGQHAFVEPPDLIQFATLSDRQVRCGRVQNLFEAGEVLAIAIEPAKRLMKNPVVQALLVKELASVSRYLANPGVLTVTVLGAAGLMTIYYPLRAEFEICQAEQVREQVRLEAERNLHIKTSRPIAIKR